MTQKVGVISAKLLQGIILISAVITCAAFWGLVDTEGSRMIFPEVLLAIAVCTQITMVVLIGILKED